jgi:hypothetical protein
MSLTTPEKIPSLQKKALLQSEGGAHPNSDIAPSHLMSVGTISSSLSGRNFAEFPHLLCLSIASSSSSSDRGEMPSIRNPGKLSEAVVSICISST